MHQRVETLDHDVLPDDDSTEDEAQALGAYVQSRLDAGASLWDMCIALSIAATVCDMELTGHPGSEWEH